MRYYDATSDVNMKYNSKIGSFEPQRPAVTMLEGSRMVVWSLSIIRFALTMVIWCGVIVMTSNVDKNSDTPHRTLAMSMGSCVHVGCV